MMGAVLQFPVRNKGRVRKSTGCFSEGGHTLIQFDCDEANLVHIKEREIEDTSTDALGSLLAVYLFSYAPDDVKDRVRRRLSIDGLFSGNPAAIALHRIIRKQGT